MESPDVDRCPGSMEQSCFKYGCHNILSMILSYNRFITAQARVGCFETFKVPPSILRYSYMTIKGFQGWYLCVSRTMLLVHIDPGKQDT